jgi:uncharacterized protein
MFAPPKRMDDWPGDHHNGAMPIANPFARRHATPWHWRAADQPLGPSRMTISLFDASVPVFQRYLGQLTSLLSAAQQHAQQQALAENRLLQARLAPDMLPLATQVEIAANFALRTCYPLAGLSLPAYPPSAHTFTGLQAYVSQVLQMISTLPTEAFDAAAERQLESRAGQALVRLPAADFVLHYALPNFFFHTSMAYAILRQQGVPVGKQDFDSFHRYPANAA